MSVFRSIRVVFAALLLTLAAALSLTATASATEKSDGATIAATCYYEVSGSAGTINIRTGPGTDYNIYTTKSSGEVVSGPCGYHYYLYRTGYWWTRLYKYDGSYVYAASIYLLPR